MTEQYRVRFRRGDFEVEVESSDKAFVDEKLAELVAPKPDGNPTPTLEVSEKPKKKTSKPAGQHKQSSGRTSRPDEELVGLVHHIQDHKDFDKLDKAILSKPGQLPRILMCLYYGAEHFDDPHFTTGEVEAVTNQFGVRILKANVGKKLKQHPTYVTMDSIRKQGTIIGYKINRNGSTYFQSLLKHED